MPHEWYDKYKKDVTAALNKGKAAPPDAAVGCTLVKMGDGTFLLCANVSAPKTAAMVKEARTNGGKVASAGSLYKGPEGVTFAVAEGSAAVKKQFSDAANEAAGKAMHVIIVAVAPPAAAPVPAAPAAPAAAPAPDFKGRVTKLVAAMNQAPKPVQEAVRPVLTQAVNLGKAGKFAEAEPLLARVETDLARAAAPPPPPPPPPPPAAPAPAAAADRGQVMERLKALKPRYLETIPANPPNKAVLEKGMAALVQAVKEGDFARGSKLLDGLEKALKMPAAAPAAAPADFAARFAASRKRWLAAREAAGNGLSALQSKLRADPDPRFKRVGEMGLNGISGRVQVGLEVALREVEINPAARGKAQKAVTEFRKFIAGDRLVGLLDENPYAVAVGLRDTLLPALADLDKVLTG